MQILKKESVFLDADNHRARLSVEITDRNGYPEFTASGQFLGSHGQCIDRINPANEDQKELIRLWTKYHLKNVSKMHNFREHLEGVLARIQHAEENRETAPLEGDHKILAQMHEEGIDSDRLEAVKAYIELNSADDLSDFEEAYAGAFASDADFARDMAEQIGAIDDSATWPINCIDWEMAGKQLMYDYSEQSGFYFRN